jgi:hypothetical protein
LGLFDGLESLGFDGLEKIDVFEKKEADAAKVKAAKDEENPMSYLTPKMFSCPVCGLDFNDYLVRKTKLRLIRVESDLRTVFHTIDPNRYDVILCIHCGYASLHSGFAQISDKQANIVMEKVMPNFKSKMYQVPLSAEDAVERYKLALFCSVAKGSKSGEKAIICLKTAWLFRSMEDAKNEQLFLSNALQLLKDAFATESFPIGSMDEDTVQIEVADLARRVNNFPEAMKWISAIMVKRNISSSLRSRAEMVRDLIREHSAN